MLTEKPYGSQAIERLAYDEGSRRLIVWFKSGRAYAYQDVERSTFDAFRAARSKGRFLQHEIRARFVARRLSESETGELDRTAAVAMGTLVRFEITRIGRCARVRVFF